MGLLFTCAQVTERLTELQEGALPPLAALRVRTHLGLCAGCRALLRSMRALPRLVREALPSGETAAPPEARSALAGALARLGQPRPRIPEPLARELASTKPDLPLRLMALAYQILAEGRQAPDEPHLPPEVLRELPTPDTWSWWDRGLGGARMARVATSEDRRHELYVLHMPGGRSIPRHHHEGAESLVVLRGGLSDGVRHGDPGDWLYYEAGHPAHAPTAEEGGCWVLIRCDAGAVRLQGWRGWIQRLME